MEKETEHKIKKYIYMYRELKNYKKFGLTRNEIVGEIAKLINGYKFLTLNKLTGIKKHEFAELIKDIKDL